MTDCAPTRRMTRAQLLDALCEHMRRAAESDARTREVIASSAATLERYRLIQELKRRGRL